MQQQQGNRDLQLEYLSKRQEIQQDFLVAQSSHSTSQQNSNQSEFQEVKETKGIQQNVLKGQFQNEEEKQSEKPTKNNSKINQLIRQQAGEDDTAKKENEKKANLDDEYLPIPPINPDDYDVPELKSIWTKIAQLEKIAQNNNEQQIQNHALKVFQQVEEYFSSFLR